MTIKIKGQDYTDFFHYLKGERHEFYGNFRKHYSGKKGAFLEMSEAQYLFWVMEKMNKRSREKLQSLDAQLISDDEIHALESLIKQSKPLRESVEHYVDVQKIGDYLPKTDKKLGVDKKARALEKELEDKMYDALSQEEKRQYGKKKFVSIVRKINLGPLKYGIYGGHGEESAPEFLIRNISLLKNYRELAQAILTRCYEEVIQTGKNSNEAKKKLDTLGQKLRKKLSR